MTIKIYLLKKLYFRIKSWYPRKRSLKELTNKKDLVVSKANKGVITAMQNTDGYVQKTTRRHQIL